MNLYLSPLLLFLAILLPSGRGMFGNNGVRVRTCTSRNAVCFFGCPPGYTWISFCHNILSCCKSMTKFLPPQAKEPWSK
ncbi:defensin beta 136 [Callithrix jacchus]|uniref:Defensin beta 136 n=1 Tax=Callithrix jacchus TaxID=9483 RepID=F6RB30_CALJA|nr:defensin beta 136 [Callithrix jacchus]